MKNHEKTTLFPFIQVTKPFLGQKIVITIDNKFVPFITTKEPYEKLLKLLNERFFPWNFPLQARARNDFMMHEYKFDLIFL